MRTRRRRGKVATLSKQFKVSAETIRKDLVELDEMGLGASARGVRLKLADRESAYSIRESSHLRPVKPLRTWLSS